MISFLFLEKYAWWHWEGKTTAKKLMHARETKRLALAPEPDRAGRR